MILNKRFVPVTTISDFRQCYLKYLVQENICKSGGQAPVAALASAYEHFCKDRDRDYQPILRNRSRIKVQPIAISSRKSGIKSSTAQPSGRWLKLSNNMENDMRVRKIFNNKKRRRNLILNPSVSVSAFMTLVDFTLAKDRPFYSSMGKPSDTEGLMVGTIYQMLVPLDKHIIFA